MAATDTDSALTRWLSQAQINEPRLTADQRGLLQHALAFRQHCGDDYYSLHSAIARQAFPGNYPCTISGCTSHPRARTRLSSTDAPV